MKRAQGLRAFPKISVLAGVELWLFGPASQLSRGASCVAGIRDEDSGEYQCSAVSEAGTTTATSHLQVVSPDSPAAARTTPAPDPRDLPGPPKPPALRARNSSTLTLVWGPPDHEGASPITSYILEMWSGAGSWQPLEEHIPAETYTVTGLKPYTQYRAIVRAMNMHGVSAASPVSGPLVTGGRRVVDGGGTTRDEDDDPQVRAALSHPFVSLLPPTAVSSTAIRLVWKVQEFGDYMDGFYIRYRDLSSGTHHFRMETVIRSGPDAYTLTDLDKYTEYEFFIVPYHKNIHGHPSNSRIASTKEDVPSAPPSGVESLVLNRTSVVLSWQPPARAHTNGRITRYSVWLFINKTQAHSNLTVGGALHSLTLHNLTFGLHFTATVAAHTKAGQGPSSGGHTWLQDPQASVGSDEARRVPSPLMAVLRETWFIGAVGAAGFVALSVFVAVVCYRRKRNEKRAMGGYKMDGRSLNGTMSGGLWIERGPWGSSSATTEDKHDATPEKLLNLNTTPGDYAEVDGSVVPLMPPGTQPPGTPVAYATTNIIRGRNGETVEPNIPVYGSMYGDNNVMNQPDDNLVLYCTLKKQQLYKPSLSPALNTKQPHGTVQRGYIPPWEQYAPPPLPENPPPDHLQQYNNPLGLPQFPQQWRHQSPMVNRAIARQMPTTGSLPRHFSKRKASPSVPKRGLNTGDFDVNSDALPPPPMDMALPGTPLIRRDPKDPLPGPATGVGLQGLQGLSGSRIMGAPGAPRLARDYSPGRLPDMYGGSSVYQGPIDEEEESEPPYNEGNAIYTDQSALYESTSAFYGSMGDKTYAADSTNPLLAPQNGHPGVQHSPKSSTLPNNSHQANGIKEHAIQHNLFPVPDSQPLCHQQSPPRSTLQPLQHNNKQALPHSR
ncbi:roundabout homolog 2 [Procambarus clarkii]|uniref:roundabout homolog 2 n=1 Tax=Procambarus clarkii TaxID=6728 RepID=UPI003743455C